MTIVTGHRYLDLLSTFTEENTGQLLDGVLRLKLHPVGLHYVQERLEALEELEALLVGAPVDYLRAYVADLGDHRALEQLRRVLRLLNSVKVVGTVQVPSRDPTPITLLPFSRLRFLELRGCDLSTSAARGLLELRPILEKLVCYNCADALGHIFSERTKEIQGAPVWSRLADVSCFGNGMLLMDESLQLLPAVEALDLSRNRFSKLANLQRCSQLKYLDAGFNNITTVAKLNKILHCVTKLILRNNAVVSTRGLHKIASLEALDLSYNLISNFREVELLGQRPSLRFLWLEGNPISFGRSYRAEALSYFPEPMQLVLDGKQTSIWESFVARRLSARRLRQRSKYGAFTPAETFGSSDLSPQLSESEKVDDAPNRAESSNGAGPSSSASSALVRSRKKSSRLASIIDVSGQNGAPRCVEAPWESSFNLSTSLDAPSPMQSVAESKEQIDETVQDLIQRAEVLKQTGSICWLRDLNDLLESEGKNKSHELEKNDLSQQNSWQKRRRRRSLRKGSLAGEATTSSEMSNKSDDHEEPNPARFSQESRGSARRASEDAPVKALSASSSSDDLQASFADNTNERPRSPHPILHDSYDGGALKFADTSGRFRLTDELVTGKMLASSSSSPPQFNQAVLRRRETLEREILRLPPERDDLSPAHDSDTSSGTAYSHLSDSSDSPLHSPSAVWHPYRFDHGQKTDPSSTTGERSDASDSSDSTSQSWSDTEAQEEESSARRKVEVSDIGGSATDDAVKSSGAPSASTTVHTAEGRGEEEPAAENSIPAVRPSENRESAGDDWLPSVSTSERKETGERGTTALVQDVEDGKDAVGKDAAVVGHSQEEKEGLHGQSASGGGGDNSSRSDESSTIREGSISAGKENSGGDEEQVSLRRSGGSSISQPKSKSSRRIVHLEGLAEVPEGSDFSNPPARESHELVNELHRAASLGFRRDGGQALERARSSSAQYSNQFNITRSVSAEANLGKGEWSRSRSQEDALASTSLQPGEGHDAGADSGMQFHRVHHVVGSFVGQCA